MRTAEEHRRLQESKMDASWERYFAGIYAPDWPDIRDRYDITVALVRGPAVLDVGCGQGLLLHLLRERRPDVKRLVGVDSWQIMLDEARRRLASEAELRLAEAERLPFDAGEFDTVVMGQVLEHVYDLKWAVDNALWVLRPGGRLIVNVPADDYEPHGLHVRVFQSLEDVQAPFGDQITWQGWGRVHRFWYAWGERAALHPTSTAVTMQLLMGAFIDPVLIPAGER